MAAKLLDNVVGIDVHAVAPIPGIPVHPYFGLVFLWHSPAFPTCNVLINGMPALSVGAMGYSVHVPQGVPVPPTPTNQTYWQRWKTNIMMAIVLMTLSIFANIAIAMLASLMPKTKSGAAERFVKDVTGIDTTDALTTCNSIMASFSSFTKWQTWVKLLMPPIPYPGAQGSVAIGSPNVTVNGGPLAFVAPLMATSCSDIPIVPNAMTLGFSNVMVGVSLSDLARALAVNAAKGAVNLGVAKGVKKLTDPPKRQSTEGSH
jgi:hypothetical protein